MPIVPCFIVQAYGFVDNHSGSLEIYIITIITTIIIITITHIKHNK